MNPKDWLSKALEELTVLVPIARNNPADAWRAATLIARLLGSPNGPMPPPPLVQMLPALLSIAGLPDIQALLDTLADELDAEGDPWGLLLDGLLDVDDLLGVLGLNDQDDEARDLAERVAALVSLYPERTIQLGSFAQMRLETVRDDSVISEVWRAIERAPAQILADALPALTRIAEPANERPTSIAPRLVSSLLPKFLHQRAADAPTSDEVVEIPMPNEVLKGWVSCEDGLMRLEVTGLASEVRTATLVAERIVDGVELARLEVDVEMSGGTAYMSLGAWSGPSNLLHKLVETSGASAEEVRVRVMVLNG